MRSKARLTITLSHELLERVDRRIDGRTLSNRSQAIETLLRQVLRPSVSTAVVLSGGERQGEDVPALASIGGQALISHTIHHLIKAGIRKFLVLAGGDEPRLRELMGMGESVGASIRYLHERRPRGTAGALGLVAPHVGAEPFLVIHGDVLTDIDVEEFISFHSSENSLATIAVKPRKSERRYGQVMLQGNRITNFFETSRNGGISIVNTGVYLFQPAVLDLIRDQKMKQLETELFPQLARMGELSAFLFQGIWYDVSTPETLERARLRWSEKGG